MRDRPDPSDVPELDCLVRGHILAEMRTPDDETYGNWCLWCGVAAWDPDKHVDAGDPS